jgi:hypothetical protein
MALFLPLFILPARDISEAARCRGRVYQDPVTSTLRTRPGAYLDERDPWRKVVICGDRHYPLLSNVVFGALPRS